MKTKISLLILPCVLLVSVSSAKNTSSIEEGKTIFSSKCAACHNINIKVVGPALAGVEQRHSIDWIIQFVHSSQSLIKNNDQAAIALFNQFNNTIMPDHTDLSAEQIKNIVEYIKSEAKAAVGKDAPPFAKPRKLEPGFMPVSITNFGFWGPYIALVLLLVLCMIAAVRVKELQRRNNETKDQSE
ncbi:MAG TPA: cytochrome c [Puia sp.]|nr:cytochrome c [Puia sp.]